MCEGQAEALREALAQGERLWEELCDRDIVDVLERHDEAVGQVEMELLGEEQADAVGVTEMVPLGEAHIVAEGEMERVLHEEVLPVLLEVMEMVLQEEVLLEALAQEERLGVIEALRDLLGIGEYEEEKLFCAGIM